MTSSLNCLYLWQRWVSSMKWYVLNYTCTCTMCTLRDIMIGQIQNHYVHWDYCQIWLCVLLLRNRRRKEAEFCSSIKSVGNSLICMYFSYFICAIMILLTKSSLWTKMNFLQILNLLEYSFIYYHTGFRAVKRPQNMERKQFCSFPVFFCYSFSEKNVKNKWTVTINATQLLGLSN